MQAILRVLLAQLFVFGFMVNWIKVSRILEQWSRDMLNPSSKVFHRASWGCALFIAGKWVWDSEQAFRDWTQSDAFRKAHANAGGSKEIYMGPPQFEGFLAVL